MVAKICGTILLFCAPIVVLLVYQADEAQRAIPEVRERAARAAVLAIAAWVYVLVCAATAAMWGI